MILDDFERIQLLKSNWGVQLNSPPPLYMKKFSLNIPELSHKFKLPHIRIKQNIIEENRERYSMKKSQRLSISIQEKPKLFNSKHENLIMIEKMTSDFERFKSIISQSSPPHGQHEDNELTFLTNHNNMQNIQRASNKHSLDLGKIRNIERSSPINLLRINQKQRRNDISPKFEVQHDEWNTKRKELTSRSPLANAYYGIKALPLRNQKILKRKYSFSQQQIQQ